VRSILLVVVGLLVIVVATLPAVGAPPTPDAQRLGRTIDAYAQPLLDRHHLSGQLLVARRGEILVERSWGFADWEQTAPVTRPRRASASRPSRSP